MPHLNVIVLVAIFFSLCCNMLSLAQAGLEVSVSPSSRKQLAMPLQLNSLLAELTFRPVDLLKCLPITVYLRVLKPWTLVPIPIPYHDHDNKPVSCPEFLQLTRMFEREEKKRTANPSE